MLDLRSSFGGSGRMVSYDELLLGDPVIDAATGLPVTRLEDGVPVIVRGPALVDNMAGGANGIARSSRLSEILFGETAQEQCGGAHRAPEPARHGTEPRHPAQRGREAPDHRVDGPGRSVHERPQPQRQRAPRGRAEPGIFEANVLPVLRTSCVGCHQPTGNSGESQTGQSFLRNRYVLTGNAEGDYNVTLTMVTDTCNAAANPLLRRPSTVPHPGGASARPCRAGTGQRGLRRHRQPGSPQDARPDASTRDASGGSAGRCPFLCLRWRRWQPARAIRPPC